MNNDIAVRATVEAEVSGFEMKPRTLDEAMKFCELMANSDLVPTAYKDKPGNIMVAIQMGSELGLSPMRSLRSIAVINGRASMWGDDVLAMVLHSPVCEYVDESASTEQQGVCKTKRKGCAEQVSIFTLADAKRAGLLGKQGPWQTNTGRMLKLRARGFGLRDTFADVLAGLVTAEEALDLPPTEAKAGLETILEASQSLSLKDKLKAKVEQIETGPQDGASTDLMAVSTQQAHDAAVPTNQALDDETVQQDLQREYRDRFAAVTGPAANAVHQELMADARVTLHMRNQLYGAYTTSLKAKPVKR